MRVGGTRLGAYSTGRGLGNQLWDLAGSVPSLDLRFAENKSLVDATTGNNLITFTRAAGPATYFNSSGVLVNATTDEPRFDHNPTTGESLGLLVEEQRTNLLVRSEEFGDANWALINSATVSSNTDLSPNNTTTADKLSIPAGGYIRQFVNTVVPATAYAISIWVKKPATGGANAIRITSNNVNAWNTGISKKVTLTSSWQRIDLTGTLVSSNTAAYVIFGSKTEADGNDADCIGDVLIWGAQLEVGAFPTSYIPTTAAAATRSADVASISGSNFSGWYRQDEGTVFAENTQAVTTGDIAYAYYIDAGSGLANSIYSDVSSGNRRGVVFVGNSVQCATNFGAISANAFVRTAFGLRQDSFGLVANGGAVNQDTSGTLPTSLTKISIANNAATSAAINGHIRRLTYWPQRLSNTTLQQITT